MAWPLQLNLESPVLLYDSLISPFNSDNTRLGDRLQAAGSRTFGPTQDEKGESSRTHSPRKGPIASIQGRETDEMCGGRIVKAACQALIWLQFEWVRSK